MTTIAPVSRSQTLSVLSKEAETVRRPSGVTTTASNQPEWAARVRTFLTVSRNQTSIVLSFAADKVRLQLRDAATALTQIGSHPGRQDLCCVIEEHVARPSAQD